MKKITIILCLAMVFATIAANASSAALIAAHHGQDPNVFTHKDAGIQFTVPTGWKAKPDGEVITVSSADESLQLVFWVPDENTFDAAVKELDKELSKTIKNMKATGKPTTDTHNGMPHYGQVGTGDVEGTTIVWSVDVLGANKPLIVLTFAAPNLFEKHSSDFEKLFGSIKKIE